MPLGYAGVAGAALSHLIEAAIESFLIFRYVCQDHGASPDVCQQSIQLGFSSVMMDGFLMADQTPANYDRNVEVPH